MASEQADPQAGAGLSELGIGENEAAGESGDGLYRGPHVTSTREIPPDAFKLRSIAGAYWRGDARNQMMTRIYGWAFGSKDELDAQVQAYQLALERDHRKLGRELEIYVLDEEVGPGLPLWLPHG